MYSPLARVIFALLGGYVIILLIFTAYEWLSEEYPMRPVRQQTSKPIQHPFYHKEALEALKQFSKLSEFGKKAVTENLYANIISMEDWLIYLNNREYQIICLGELHTEATRDFLAKEFFSKFSADVLLLECTTEKLNSLIRRMESGRDYFPLLNADIMSLLRAAKKRNSDIDIFGIEESYLQKSENNNELN
jgi:hypothetical protein